MDKSPELVAEYHTVEPIQTPTPTHKPHQQMIIEEDPTVPAPTRNTTASLQIPIMITQEDLQAVEFDVMTHQPSAFTPSNMKQPNKQRLNLKHYCAPVLVKLTVVTSADKQKL